MKRFIPGLMLVCLLMGLATPVSAISAVELSDIKGDEWYASAVTEMVQAGIINGFPDKTFRAAEVVSSAEFITMVAKAVVAPVGAGREPWTSSKVKEHWAGLTLETAFNANWCNWGIAVQPYSESDKPILKRQAAVILLNAFRGKLKTLGSVPVIRDECRLDEDRGQVLAAYQYGILTGDGQGNCNAESTLTRAEAAMLVYRALKVAEMPEDFWKDETAGESRNIFELYKEDGRLKETSSNTLASVDSAVPGITVTRNAEAGSVSIKMAEIYGGYSETSRAMVKELLKIAYPEKYEEAYLATIDTMLDCVFERRNMNRSTAGALRFIDQRSFTTELISSGDKAVSIRIGNYGDYEDFKLQAKISGSSFSYRSGSVDESILTSQKLIDKYNMSERTKDEVAAIMSYPIQWYNDPENVGSNVYNMPRTAERVIEVYTEKGLIKESENALMVPTDPEIEAGIWIANGRLSTKGVDIALSEPFGGYSEASRAYLKELLKIAYPKSYEEAYALTIQTMLDIVHEIYANKQNPAGVASILDDRPFVVRMVSPEHANTRSVFIYIGDYVGQDFKYYNSFQSWNNNFEGYEYLGGSLDESARIRAELIQKYGIEEHEYSSN